MNTAILITVRLKSTRLPLKALKEIKGRPMIGHLIDRLKLAQVSQQIIICTSTLPQDDPLEEIAAQESIECFRGDPDDVLLRLTRAAEKFKVDQVCSCTGDNPFIDPVYLDRLMKFHVSGRYDLTTCAGLPLGVGAYAVSHSAMQRACEIKAEKDTEMWGPLFTDTGQFACAVFSDIDEDVRWPALRLTVDTPEDFSLITAIFDELYQPGQVFPLTEIVALCRRRPDLVALNSAVQQRVPTPIKIKAESEN